MTVVALIAFAVWALCAYFGLRKHHQAIVAFAVFAIGASVVHWQREEAVREAAREVLKKYEYTTHREVDGDRYATSAECRSCHLREYNAWKRSYHSTMTQLATPEAIIPKWDGVKLETEGRTYNLIRRGDQFLVDMPKYGTRGLRNTDRMTQPVIMTTGSHHQQLYWIPVPWAQTATSAHGAYLYRKWCANCHEQIGGSVPTIVKSGLPEPIIALVFMAPNHRAALDGFEAKDRRALIDYVLRRQTNDHLMQFPFAYLTKEQRFVPERLTFLQPEPPFGSPLEPLQKTWSDNCAPCHSLVRGFSKSAQNATGGAKLVELGIACESCHGPAQDHVDYYRDPIQYNRSLGNDEPAKHITLPTRLDKARAAAVCGQCHSRSVHKEGREFGYRVGQRLEETRHIPVYQEPPYPDWLKRDLGGDDSVLTSSFWKDGTIRITGREYNALTQSECHLNGELTCTTCHKMHGDEPNDQLKPEAQDNQVCAGCHREISERLTEHTHHPADSPASLCYNCHMPRTTLGLLTAVRAHRIDVPSIANSVRTGRPNACNLCHLDQTFDAMSDAMSDWYGTEKVKHSPFSAGVTWLLKGDAVQRGVAAWHFGWAPAHQASDNGWMAPFLAETLLDPYPVVRYYAAESIRTLPGFKVFSFDYTNPDTSKTARDIAAMTWFATEPPLKLRTSILMTEEGPESGLIEAFISERDNTPISIFE